MAKEINEKTFELNITSELLNISKSFIYYMLDLPVHHLMSENEWFDFFSSNTLFAEGLTQAQETNPQTGGYDVSINYNSNNGTTGRLLFLQYKSGTHSEYCMNSSSRFYGSRNYKNPHIIFHFNDAANNTQHSTLRSLANKVEIEADSVLYVFPRIIKKSDLFNNNGSLLAITSFVPVLEIDRQANRQNPPVQINNDPHKYRTSYDGNFSEVNLLFFLFEYDNRILSNLVSELICVQLERFFRASVEKNIFRANLLNLVKNRIINTPDSFRGIYLNKEIITSYINQFDMNDFADKIPTAPQKYTTEIPLEGLRFTTNNTDRDFPSDNIFNNVSYQIF